MYADVILVGFFVAGLVLAFNGVVQLFVRNKTGPWKEGGVRISWLVPSLPECQ